MKIKELIDQLSKYNQNAEIEMLYSEEVETEDGEFLKLKIIEDIFYIVPDVDDVHNLNPTLFSKVYLATEQAILT